MSTDVLLLHPSETTNAFGGMPPLGLGWIASYLESRGISTMMVDRKIDKEDVHSLLKRSKPSLVGIGGTTHSRFESFRLAREIKRFDANIVVVYGGPHASFTANDTLGKISEIDYIVRGEGEITMYQIAESVLRGKADISSVPGVSYRGENGIINNAAPARISNLDNLPFPKRNHDDLKRYDLRMDFLDTPGASVITSRGCPINCSFCSASAMFGDVLTFRSAANVVDEIEMLLKEYHYEGIKFFDSTLTLRRSHIESLCREIKRRNLHFPWECEIRVNSVSKELLRTMQEAGCYYVDFGVESASPRILESIHKNITLEQVVKVFVWTHELGIMTKVFFTFGHAGERVEDARATVEFMERYSKYMTLAATGVGVRVYPGTEVEQYAVAHNLLGQDFSWSGTYFEPKIEALGNDPIVPVLVQPQFGWSEFSTIEYRLLRFWLKNPILTLRALLGNLKVGRGLVLLRLLWRFLGIQIGRYRIPSGSSSP